MMRSTTNILIINLALSDLLFVIFCVPFTGNTTEITTKNLIRAMSILMVPFFPFFLFLYIFHFTATDYILTNWPFGNFWCKFVSVTNHNPLNIQFFIGFEFIVGSIHDCCNVPWFGLHFGAYVT